MALVPAKCTNCGGALDVDPNQEAAVCKYCGTPFIVEKAINNYNININISNQNDSQSTRLLAEEAFQRQDFSAAADYYKNLFLSDHNDILSKYLYDISDSLIPLTPEEEEAYRHLGTKASLFVSAKKSNKELKLSETLLNMIDYCFLNDNYRNNQQIINFIMQIIDKEFPNCPVIPGFDIPENNALREKLLYKLYPYKDVNPRILAFVQSSAEKLLNQCENYANYKKTYIEDPANFAYCSPDEKKQKIADAKAEFSEICQKARKIASYSTTYTMPEIFSIDPDTFKVKKLYLLEGTFWETTYGKIGLSIAFSALLIWWIEH